MQSVTVDRKSANTKIEKYIQSLYPGLSYSTLQKAFRKKDIKVNGVRVGRDHTVLPGDKLEIYITDELLNGIADPMDKRSGVSDTGAQAARSRAFSVLYEDENLLIVNKMQGIPVHPDKGQSNNTLIDMVREYLKQKDGPTADPDFQPSLCHRLDRNTGGLVLIAKTRESHEFLLDKLETREIKKFYQCLVKGRMERKEAVLNAYLWKDASKSRVFVSDRRTAGALEITTGYRVLEYDPAADTSRLEVELITGRTHQIRAHLAFIGHPILGDGKYGTNAVNRSSGMKYQALWACKIKFAFTGKNPLDYLNGREFQVDPGF